jgi:hypothetical protein
MLTESRNLRLKDLPEGLNTASMSDLLQVKEYNEYLPLFATKSHLRHGRVVSQFVQFS